MQETATPSPHRLLPNMNTRPTEERGVKASQGHPLGEGPQEGHSLGGGGGGGGGGKASPWGGLTLQVLSSLAPQSQKKDPNFE